MKKRQKVKAKKPIKPGKPAKAPVAAKNIDTATAAATATKTQSSIKIGEFLQILEVVSPEVLEETLASAKELDVPIGRATVLRGLLTNAELANLVELHCLVRSNTISIGEAREAFDISRRKSWSIRDALLATGCPVDELGSLRIGELLREADLIADKELDLALSLQDLCGLPIGRILTIDAKIPQAVVNEALDLQKDMREKKRHLSDAIKKLRRKSGPWKAKSNTKEFPGYDRPMFVDLDALLIVGKVCTERDLNPARSFALANRLQVQEVLRGFTWLDNELVSAASALSGLVRDGYIAGDEAIIMLRALGDANFNKERATMMASRARFLSLYQFLMMSGYLAPENIRDLVRYLISDPDLFEEVVGTPKHKFQTRQDLKRAVVSSITDNDRLENALLTIFDTDEKLLAYGRDLVCLISLGAITTDQAILSFARMRHFSDLKKNELESEA